VPTSPYMQSKRLLATAPQFQAASLPRPQQMGSNPTREHPIPADPTHAITLAANFSNHYDNLRDGVVGTRLPHSTCSLSDSLQKPFLIRQRALLLLQQKGFSQTCEHPIPGNFPHATSNDRTRLCHSSLSFSIMRCAELQLLYSTFQMQLKTEGVDSRYVLLFWAKAQFRENVL